MHTTHRLKQAHALTRGRGVTAAQRAFNPHGEGSNPSDLMEEKLSVFSRQFSVRPPL